MKYNLKELIYEEEKPLNEKVNININIPTLNELLLNTPKDITIITTSALNTRVGLLNGIILNTNNELAKLSNSDSLNAVTKLVTRKDLPEIKISGYNYTNLDKVITVKNPFVQIINNFDDLLGEINEIVKMPISDDEKKFKLSKLSIEVDIKMSDFGFGKSDELPQYYRDDSDNLIDIIVSDYEKVYKDIKTCKRYITQFTGYAKVINKYTDTINKMVSGKEITDAYNKYNTNTPIGKEITRLLMEECKLLNIFSELMSFIITTQINEVKDSLKQDINILNNLVKEYRK